jgi:hypothetical protein
LPNVPEGTYWFGGPVDRCEVSLRICGDDLDPDEITSLMGVMPTRSHRRGEAIVSSNGKHSRICKRGIWSIKYEPIADSDADLESTIMSLLSQLPSETSVWSSLSAKYEIDLFCGLFLEAPNRGLTLSAKLLKCLGDRGVELGFDVYSPDFDTALESFRKGPPAGRIREGRLKSNTATEQSDESEPE